MMTFRNMLYCAATFALAACGTLPLPAPAATPTTGMPDPLPTQKQPSVEPVTLADSIPAAMWQENIDGHLLVPIDPASGQAIPGFEPIEIQQAIFHAFSPDRSRLAVIGFESSQNPRNGRLHLVDLRTWQRQVQDIPIDGYINAMAFGPDGKQLAIAHGSGKSQILILDISAPLVKAQAAARQVALDFQVYKMKFSLDGRELMVYGAEIENRFTVSEMSPNPPLVNLFDSADLSLRWEASLAGVRHGVVPKDENATMPDLHQPGQAVFLSPGLAFAPHQNVLYVVHPQEEKLTTVDFGTQTVKSVEIRPRLSFMERLLALTAGVAHAKVAQGTSKQAAISPDGRFLYIVGLRTDLMQEKNGNWQVSENPLGLQVIRAEDGSRLASYNSRASELAISPDGQFLYLRGRDETGATSWTEIFDTSTRQTVARLEGMWLVPTRRISGAPALASSVLLNNKGEHHNAVVDSYEVLAQWNTPGYITWLATQ